MSARVVALYGHPTDPAAFDAYYASTHTPIAQRIPGLRRLGVSRGSVRSPDGSSPFHCVAVLDFDSIADVEAAFASPEGQATAGDLDNFATGGVTLLLFDEAGFAPAPAS